MAAVDQKPVRGGSPKAISYGEGLYSDTLGPTKPGSLEEGARRQRAGPDRAVDQHGGLRQRRMPGKPAVRSPFGIHMDGGFQPLQRVRVRYGATATFVPASTGGDSTDDRGLRAAKKAHRDLEFAFQSGANPEVVPTPSGDGDGVAFVVDKPRQFNAGGH